MVDARPSAGWGSRVAAVITAIQSLTLLALVAFYGVELSHGAGSDRARVVMSMVLMLVFAGGLVALARALWHRPDPARTPTIVWNVLLLPVGWTLARSGSMALGVAVLVTSWVAIGAIVAQPGRG